MAKNNKQPSIPLIESAVVDGKPLRFSFKHLDLKVPKFHSEKCGSDFFRKLLEILQRFSTWTVSDFIDQNNNEHRHIIDFAATSEPEGFQHVPALDRDQAGYVEGWQFAVDIERPWCEWRVHGILVDDIFYVVWLDPDHALYSPKLLPAAPENPN